MATDTTDLPETPTAEPSEWAGTNLAADIVERGIQRNKAEYQDDLRWWYRYSVERKMGDGDCAEQLGVDRTTYQRIMRGEYRSHANKLVLAPPAKMLSRIRVLRQQFRDDARNRNRVRVMTPTVQIIWQICAKAARDHLIAFLFGESHIGKTAALLWYRDEHNHGSTIYVDLQGVSGEQDIYREFARALGLSADTSLDKLKPRVVEALGANTLVLIDEFHAITHAYQKGGAVRMINALKSIKDRSGCGMVICTTEVGRKEIQSGTDSKLLNQIWRRGVLKRQLPAALRVGDVRAVAESFGLPFPAAVEDADTWAALGKREPGFEGLACAEDIAWHFGIEHLFTVLREARDLASRKDRELSWSIVREVHAFYGQQLTAEAV